MMNPMVMKGAKIAVKVVAAAAPMAVAYFDNKELKEKIAKMAKEAVAEAMKKES